MYQTCGWTPPTLPLPLPSHPLKEEDESKKKKKGGGGARRSKPFSRLLQAEESQHDLCLNCGLQLSGSSVTSDQHVHQRVVFHFVVFLSLVSFVFPVPASRPIRFYICCFVVAAISLSVFYVSLVPATLPFCLILLHPNPISLHRVLVFHWQGTEKERSP